MREVYPVTVVKDSYKGKYTGGKYLAFNRHAKYVDPNVSNSKESWEAFVSTREIYGIGSTEIEAEADLASKVIIF